MVLQTLQLSAQGSNTELFLEIPEQGKYSVYLNEESITSSKGRYRFYNVENSSPTLTILQNSKQLVRARIRVTANNRVIFTYSKSKGLTEIITLPLFQNKKYALDDWDGQLSNQPDRTSGPGRQDPLVMNETSYQALLSMVKKQDFDETKFKTVKAALASNKVSAAQLTGLIKTLDFDAKRLELAKFAFDYVADKQNFFQVAQVFDFDSNKNELMDYVNKKSGR